MTAAFVDGRPIEWEALLARARTSADRALLEHLRVVDRMRVSPASRPSHAIGWRSRVVTLLAGLAALQTGCCLGAVAIAAVAGDPIAFRTTQIVLAAGFAAAAILLGSAASRDPRSLFLVAGFTAVAGAFARGAAAALPGSYTAPLAPLLRGLFPEAFIPACMWQFALDFPRVRRFTAFDVLARRAAAAAWLLGLFLFAINLAGAYSPLVRRVPVDLMRNAPGNAFWSLIAFALVPALTAILVRARRAALAERSRAARLALAVALGTGPLLLCGIARAVMPAFDGWFLTAGAGRTLLDTLIVAALAATPILATVAVLADRPFEPQSTSRLRPARLLIAALARGHQERLVEALDRIRTARGAREICTVLGRELGHGIGAAMVKVLVPGRGGVFMDPSMEVTPLGPQALLIAALREGKGPLDVGSGSSSSLALLARSDRDWLAVNGIALAAPVRHRNGHLAAIVVCGAKPGADPFSRSDLWFVTTLTMAAAAAWDAGGFIPGNAPDEAAFECGRCGRVVEWSPLPCACGGDLTLASLPRLLAGKFVVERRLGAGGMGVVYLARDTALDRPVALKTLPGLREGEIERLRHEARAMAALNHPALATLYGIEMWRHTPVLVVEYFPAGTLDRRLTAGPLPPAAAVRLGIALARALAYMHATGVLHRDLKPANIAFTAAGMPKLLDFGLAAATESSAGTPAYMPPEAFQGARPAASFDLWALSVVLLEAVGGRRLAPLPLDAFLERALARDPARRFQTAPELLAALELVERAIAGPEVTAVRRVDGALSAATSSATPCRPGGCARRRHRSPPRGSRTKCP